ncbi:MAG: hypothetical protein ACI87O_001038 [Planctomycetota bacterium]|jgi:hypothetical protein
MTSTDLFLIHVACTWALVGLIWIVQWVQYPGFRLVGEAQWKDFHESHCARIAWVVAPLMFGEVVTGIALLVWPLSGVSREFLSVGLGLILVIWVSTAALSVPLHHQLKHHNPKTQQRLVLTNWVRTIAWTIRGLGALYLLREWVA